jgi:hypothetical protein
MKKALLIIGVLALLVSAGAVWANTDWHGKFWGETREGEWKGTIVDEAQDPPYFTGEWSDGLSHGKIYAVLEKVSKWEYKIVKSVVYNSKGFAIGKWDGHFDLNVKPGLAEGEWKTLWGEYGKWKGQRIW